MNIDTNNIEFQDALSLIQYTSQSVFLTGKAGTGKSTFLKYICENTRKKHIVLVTGGQRSGKSGYAQKLALSLTANPVYLATSRVWDEEFRERVLRHQADRGPEWTNIEEEKYLSRHDLNGRVVVIDCVTLWGTNFFFDNEGDTNRSLGELKEEFNKFTEQDAYLIFVTNEIGLGGVSPDVVQRRFTDLQGWLNQYIASRADEVVLMVSGIPMKVK